MTELSRSLIAAAREGLAPDPEVAARVRARVAAALAAGAAGAAIATGSHASAATAQSVAASSVAPGASAAASVAAPSVATGASAVAATAAAAGSTSLAIKLGAVLVVLGVGAFGVAVVSRGGERVSEVPPIVVAASPIEEIAASERVAAPNEPLVHADEPRSRNRTAAPAVDAPQPPLRAEAAARRSSESASVDSAPVNEPAPTSASASLPEPVSLSREVELIDLAMVSLRKNAPRAAIEAIRVFERETLGKGQMAEEAAAIEIEARCMLREDVTVALARFDRTWPESAQRERIQTACFARR